MRRLGYCCCCCGCGCGCLCRFRCRSESLRLHALTPDLHPSVARTNGAYEGSEILRPPNRGAKAGCREPKRRTEGPIPTAGILYAVQTTAHRCFLSRHRQRKRATFHPYSLYPCLLGMSEGRRLRVATDFPCGMCVCLFAGYDRALPWNAGRLAKDGLTRTIDTHTHRNVYWVRRGNDHLPPSDVLQTWGTRSSPFPPCLAPCVSHPAGKEDVKCNVDTDSPPAPPPCCCFRVALNRDAGTSQSPP